MKKLCTLAMALALTGCAANKPNLKIITLANGLVCSVPENSSLGLYKDSTDCRINLGDGGRSWLPIVGHNYSTFRSHR